MKNGIGGGRHFIVLLLRVAVVVKSGRRASGSPLECFGESDSCGGNIQPPQSLRVAQPLGTEGMLIVPSIQLIQKTSVLLPRGTVMQPAGLLAVETGITAQLHDLIAKARLNRGAIMNVVAGVIGLLLVVVLLIVALLLQSQFIGDKVRQSIEQYDKDYLGVDVTFGNVKFSSLTGNISIKDMLVFNPPGYKSTHLLKVGTVKVSIDTRQLAYGCFSFDKVTLDRIIIRDVEIVYEETWTSSNIHDLTNFLSYGDFNGTAATPQVPAPVQPEPVTTVNGSQQGKTPEGDQWLTLHELRVEHAQVKLASHTFQDAGVNLQIADVVYSDFNKELGDYMVDDIIKFVLKSILSTAASQLAAPFGGHGGGRSRKFGCC